MALTPPLESILIGQVNAWIEISLGMLWATLTSDEVLELARGVLIAEATARFMAGAPYPASHTHHIDEPAPAGKDT